MESTNATWHMRAQALQLWWIDFVIGKNFIFDRRIYYRIQQTSSMSEAELDTSVCFYSSSCKSKTEAVIADLPVSTLLCLAAYQAFSLSC